MSTISFDVSEKWAILVPPDTPHIKKSVEDLSRCIGLLAGDSSKPQIVPGTSDSSSLEAVIVLNNDESGPERNGFEWRAGKTRVEIFGESGRGLCNGIYSFLTALGVSWPAPGQEKLPAKDPSLTSYPLSGGSACEPSHYEGKNPAAAPWRRYIAAGKRETGNALKNCTAFAAWAARQRFDALIFPLAAFASWKTGRKLKQLKQSAAEYGIVLEAGGWDLSSLIPRRHFFFHRDSFRMDGGKREKTHHFCPTSPDAMRIMDKEGRKLFQTDMQVFHLWLDKEAETAWCSCPACRAFTAREQGRMGANATADILAAVNPGAFITYYEKPGEVCKIPLRKNIYKIETLPQGKETHQTGN
ncbi:MAG: hypothetical protein LBH42_08400 [Treponema sp.]|jgi:hypothetical protein|nr:hypothetical protein [Treponema sp.]